MLTELLEEVLPNPSVSKNTKKKTEIIVLISFLLALLCKLHCPHNTTFFSNLTVCQSVNEKSYKLFIKIAHKFKTV